MNSSESQRPKVLIVTSSVGAGHNQVARAIFESLRSRAPQIDATVADVLEFTPWVFRASYAGGFALGMSRLPRTYGLSYRLTNHPQGPRRGVTERLRLRAERFWMRRFARYVLDLQPDVVLCTHFLSVPVIVRLIEQGRLRARVMVAVTDIEVHRFWYSPDVDRWFLPSEYSADAFRRWGVAAESLTVSGIAIHARWTTPLDRSRIVAEWRLPADRKIVLLSGGAEFTCGPVVRIVRAVLESCPEACVVALAGRNKKLLGRLSKLPEAGDRLFPVAFTDRVHELVEVCSLMVTKAGGITTAECLAKGTPMVMIRSVPGHEAGNAEYLAREGAAVLTRNPRRIAAEVRRLLRDDEALERMGQAARRMYRPATQTIVEAICGMVLSSD